MSISYSSMNSQLSTISYKLYSKLPVGMEAEEVQVVSVIFAAQCRTVDLSAAVVGIDERSTDCQRLAPVITGPHGITHLPVDRHIRGPVAGINRIGIISNTGSQQPFGRWAIMNTRRVVPSVIPVPRDRPATGTGRDCYFIGEKPSN